MAKSKQSICVTVVENTSGEGIVKEKHEYSSLIVNTYLFRDFDGRYPLSLVRFYWTDE